jgi:hypothetical protein
MRSRDEDLRLSSHSQLNAEFSSRPLQHRIDVVANHGELEEPTN